MIPPPGPGRVMGVPGEHHLRCALCLRRLSSGCDSQGGVSTTQDLRKTWLVSGSLLLGLVEEAVSGTEIAAATAFYFRLSGTLSPPGGEETGIQLALLSYSLNPLFCRQARLHHALLELEPFVGKFIFFIVEISVYSVGVFFSQLCCLESKLPTDPPCERGFPTVCKLPLHNSLPRTGLHP